MYIKCTTVEQLDEVKKYYNIREAYMSTINMFKSYNNEESICMDKYGNWSRYSFIKERNLEYITYSEWKLQTLRDLGFDTDLANDMLSRIDKDKRNDMNKKDQFIQLEGGKLNITKAKELGLWVEDESNWSSVKKGTKVKYVYDKLMNGMIEHITPIIFEIKNKSYTNLYMNGTFYDFVSETNQVLILVGDSVIVKDASEVEVE